LKLNFLGSGSAACGDSGLLLLHIDPPKGQPPKQQQDVQPGKAKLYALGYALANGAWSARALQLLDQRTGSAKITQNNARLSCKNAALIKF
jgi:hypothetical protein